MVTDPTVGVGLDEVRVLHFSSHRKPGSRAFFFRSCERPQKYYSAIVFHQSCVSCCVSVRGLFCFPVLNTQVEGVFHGHLSTSLLGHVALTTNDLLTVACLGAGEPRRWGPFRGAGNSLRLRNIRNQSAWYLSQQKKTHTGGHKFGSFRER